jgi:hypothetical protein
MVFWRRIPTTGAGPPPAAYTRVDALLVNTCVRRLVRG